jgi:hypothetical protein
MGDKSSVKSVVAGCCKIAYALVEYIYKGILGQA